MGAEVSIGAEVAATPPLRPISLLAQGERRKAIFWGLTSLLVGGPAAATVGALAGGLVGALAGLVLLASVAFLPTFTVGAGRRGGDHEHRMAASALQAALFDTWPWATIGCISLLFAAFVAAQVGPPEWAVRTLARSTPEVLHGQLWRLLSPALVHANTEHLVGNLLALFFLGGAVERLLGRRRFLAVILVGVAVGSVTSAIAHPQVVGVGASGAVFAAVGALFGFGAKRRRALPLVFWQCDAVWVALAATLLAPLDLRVPRVDVAAHVGGLCAGLVLGLLFRARAPLEAALAGIPYTSPRIRSGVPDYRSPTRLGRALRKIVPGSVLLAWAALRIEPELLGPGVAVVLGIIVAKLIAFSLMLPGRRGRIRIREAVLERLPLAGAARILDIGCGRGLLLNGAARRLTRGRAFGLDLWPESGETNITRDNARTEGVEQRVSLIRADLRALPFQAGTFDVVTAAFVLSELGTWHAADSAVAGIVRLVRPGGVLALIGPDDAVMGLAALRRAGLRIEECRGRVARGWTVAAIAWVPPAAPVTLDVSP